MRQALLKFAVPVSNLCRFIAERFNHREVTGRHIGARGGANGCKQKFLCPVRARVPLRAPLASAIDGAPQIILLSGTAGSGKTTLIREFCRRNQQTESELLVVYTQCNSQSGAGDPYLPFKEALALLTGVAGNDQDRKSLSA